MMKARLRATRQALLTTVAGLWLAACAGQPTTSAGMAAAEVTRLIGDAACSSDDDCATIGIGALACGGPQSYAAWSKKQTDAQALAAAAARHREERERQIVRSGEMSLCRVVPDPGARCSAARRCELRAAGSGGAAAAIR